ncbi:hypothetical protein HPB49_015332 [Dermacentor silvarum]|uniref:Uncharacterized protein n=1 Tax=Dermacentor silvarum TaxID=543639 RepID=A0ACB8E189_DERSI|nr:hypothetical protein HPB49_015332 [Dermacentor silvarum]
MEANINIQVFPEDTSQEQVFQEAVQDRVNAFVKGANVLLFAFGPTACGKTHIMEGPPTDPGVVPHTLERVFRLLSPRCSKPSSYNVFVVVMPITKTYNV